MRLSNLLLFTDQNYDKTFEIIGLKKNGTPFPIEITARPFQDKGKKVGVASLRDITERKKNDDCQ